MRFIAKTLYGLEQVLARELTDSGASKVEIANRAVFFEGDKRLLYQVNYCSRTALSFLQPVSEFRIRTKEDLYSYGQKIEWTNYLDENGTFSVSPVVNSTLFGHTGYAALVLKDSIADYFRKKTGERPSVDTVNPDLLINLHISNDKVTVSLDSSVVPLFKRGYRLEQTSAPLNEALAAGILLISGWEAQSSLTDPMCGSGTIPIEAALIARRVPPGKFRQFFGFQKWKDFDDEMFLQVKQEADSRIIESPVKISASDISPEAVKLAASNIRRAGMENSISIEVADFKDIKSIDNQGFVFMNPPYGQRLNPDELDMIYSMIGTTLKHSFDGNTAWLITSNRESLKKVGLKPSQKHILFNGALECMLLKYELYQGSRKNQAD
jgi:putative N6-adenine-specific DNA methylase